MNHRIIAVVLFIASLVAILIGYFLLHPEIIGLCPRGLDMNCLNQNLSFGIGEPLYWSIRWLPVLFLSLAFVRREVFIAWWKVMIWFFILALLLIVISPTTQTFFTPDRTTVTDLVVKVIVIVSIVVVLWKYWRLSKGKAKKTL